MVAPNYKTPLAIYGFGATGQRMIDALLTLGIPITFIIDKNKHGQTYQDIPIIAPDAIAQHDCSQLDCLIALNNHYIDTRAIDQLLRQYDFKQVLTLPQINNIADQITIDNGYWLDPSFNDDDYASEIDAFINLLVDEKSISLAKQIIRYRTKGHIEDYPEPSLQDEYTPSDLPRYRSPLRVIDCGAFNGIAIEKLIAADYEIDAFAAFEPDPDNFKQLTNKSFNVKQAICLPLGVWSSTTQLRFHSEGNMGSCLAQRGDTVVQCVSVDDTLPDFAPNLIKFDVEGAEIEAIYGLENTIKTYRPNLAISVYHTPTHLFEIALLINAWQLDYHFHLRVHEHNTFGTVLYCLQDSLIC